jgi:hypothetical protein
MVEQVENNTAEQPNRLQGTLYAAAHSFNKWFMPFGLDGVVYGGLRKLRYGGTLEENKAIVEATGERAEREHSGSALAGNLVGGALSMFTLSKAATKKAPRAPAAAAPPGPTGGGN